MSIDLGKCSDISKKAGQSPAFCPVSISSPVSGDYNIKDRLNVTIAGIESTSHQQQYQAKPPPLPFILNSRFVKGKRMSINARMVPSRPHEPTSMSRASPTAMDHLFNNTGMVQPVQNITFIKPQINNVTIITANQKPPNSSKGRTALAKYIQ